MENSRTRRRNRVIEEVVDAAERVLTERGMEALTVAAIAEVLDLTPGALYRYFASKDAILARVHQRHVILFSAELDGALADCTDARSRVEALATCLWAYLRRDEGALRLVAMSLADPRVLVSDAEVAPVIAEYLALLKRCVAVFAAARTAGHLAEGDDLVDLDRVLALASGLVGILQVEKVASRSGGLVSSSRVAEVFVSGLLQGWSACREGGDR